MRIAPLTLASVAVVALVPLWVLGVYLPSFNTPHTLLEGVPLARSALPPQPALARRVAVLVVDGLSLEVARSLEELEPLRRAGTLRGIVPEYPSFTSPAITSFVTGAGPRDSGVRLNGELGGALPLDSLTASAADAGVPVRVYARGWEPFADLVRARRADVRLGHVGFLAYTASRAAAAPFERPFEASGPTREVVLGYFGEPDESAHERGAASPEYLEGARHAGALAARFASTLDLERDAIVVLSDHAHRADGGHGGTEPEVLRAFFLAAGAGVKKDAELGERPMRDVASTLSMLAGLRVPAANQGRPMLDLLARPGANAALLAAPFDQASRTLCALEPAPRCADTPGLLARLRAGESAAVPEAEALMDDLAAARERRLAEGAASAAWRRLVTAAALACVAVALVVAMARRPRVAEGASEESAARGLVFPALLAVVYAAFLGLLGYRSTFSRMTHQGIFIRDGFAAVALAAIVVLLAWRRLRAPAVAPWVMLATTTLPFGLLAAWVGADHASLAPPLEGVLVFQSAPAVAGAALVAVAMHALRPRAR